MHSRPGPGPCRLGRHPAPDTSARRAGPCQPDSGRLARRPHLAPAVLVRHVGPAWAPPPRLGSAQQARHLPPRPPLLGRVPGGVSVARALSPAAAPARVAAGRASAQTRGEARRDRLGSRPRGRAVGSGAGGETEVRRRTRGGRDGGSRIGPGRLMRGWRPFLSKKPPDRRLTDRRGR